MHLPEIKVNVKRCVAIKRYTHDVCSSEYNVTIGDTAIAILKHHVVQKVLFMPFRDLCGRVAIFLMLTLSIDTDT